MDILNKHQIPQVSYLTRWLRWLIAIAAGILMVYLSEPDNWAELHRYDGYTLAIFASCVIAILLTKLVNFLSIWLDRKVSWAIKPLERLILQLSFGVVLPIGLAVLAIWYYFYRHGLSLNETTYYDRVFSTVCTFVLIANLYYPTHFFVMLYFRNPIDKETFADIPLTISEDSFVAKHDKENETQLVLESDVSAEVLTLPPNYKLNDIFLVRSEDRELFSYSASAEKLVWENTIRHSIALLPQTEFFKISKSTIVNKSNIIKAQYCSSNRIELLLHSPQNETVRVSQRNCANFCQWYDKKVLPAKPKA